MTTEQSTVPEATTGELIKALMSYFWRRSYCDMLHVMQAAELSMPQLVALMFLRRRAPASISALRNHLNLSLATTSHLVDRLVQAGYASRTEDVADRRQKQVALTAAGHELVEKINQAQVNSIVGRLAQASPEVLEATTTLLNTVVPYLVDEPKSAPMKHLGAHILHDSTH